MKSVANLDADIRSGGAQVADSHYDFPSLQPSEGAYTVNYMNQGAAGALSQVYTALDENSSLGHPFVYTKYDAARIYLNSVNKKDITLPPDAKKIKE